MRLTVEACVAFERDINLFVDRELPEAESRHLVEHLEACPGCKDYLQDLRELAGVHRDTAATEVAAREAVAAVVDRHRLFSAITGRLLADKQAELARLLYELGKAYVLVANEAQANATRRPVLTVTRPADIRATTDHGRRVANEGRNLAANPLRPDPALAQSASLFGRSRRLFSSSTKAGTGALANGRRMLLAALELKPDLDEARIYLAFSNLVGGRNDRARVEFRRVYREARDPVHRMMALQFLGNLYTYGGDLRRAVECYEEVVASGLVEREPRLFTSLVNLAVQCAKLGLPARCVQHFSELVTRFPAQVDQTRVLLSRMETFAEMLRREVDLHETLRRQVPALFAA